MDDVRVVEALHQLRLEAQLALVHAARRARAFERVRHARPAAHHCVHRRKLPSATGEGARA
jgi:hypothetical protein